MIILNKCSVSRINLTTGDSMCGKYPMFTKAVALEERFQALLATEVRPTYHAAPSQELLTMLNDHPQAIV
jgi:putative SOS response-associated peptidase YedK